MPTDQIFKQLLIAFFHEFLRLFFPAIAEAIDPATLAQRTPELFTDLVFEGQTRAHPPMAVLLHTEIQAERDEAMPDRMWQYNAGLESRAGLPVISAVVALHGGTAGVSLERHSRTLFGATYPRLAYWQVGLRDLDAATYLRSDLPLATALAALMRPGPLGRHGLKIALIRRVQASAIDRARLSLIVNVIESYLRLNADEQQAFREQLRAEGDETVEATELTWAEEMIQQGIARGIAQGREEGVLDAKREIALLQIRARFGPPDAALRTRIEASDGPALDHLLERLPAVASVEQLVATLN